MSLICLYVVSSLFFGLETVSAQESTVAVVYFRGVGCPRCANTDPLLMVELPKDYGAKLVVIEYEVYQHPENALVFNEYNATYGTGLGVPLVVLATTHWS